MRLRHACVTLALATLPALVATPAHAISCPLVPDNVGDAGFFNSPTLYSAHVDATGVDVASGPTTVVVRMTLASLDPDLFSNLGPEWIVGWKIGSTSYSVQARRTGLFFLSAGYVSDFRVNSVSTGPVPVAIDVVNDTITWTVPRTLLPDLATPGATFTKFAGSTLLLSSTADSFSGLTATYVDQSPGCVAAA